MKQNTLGPTFNFHELQVHQTMKLGEILNQKKKSIAIDTKVPPNMFCPHSFMLPFLSPKLGPNDILYITQICYAHFITCDAIPILMECMQTTCQGMSFPPIRVYVFVITLPVHFNTALLCFLLWYCCIVFDPLTIQIQL